MLRALQMVVVLMLVWGSLASATTANQEKQTISSWMAHLNFYYQDLKVTTAPGTDLNNPKVRIQLMNDLQSLEQMLGRGLALPDSSLQQIACGRPECNGGGGGGKCSTCSAE